MKITHKYLKRKHKLQVEQKNYQLSEVISYEDIVCKIDYSYCINDSKPTRNVFKYMLLLKK